MTKEEFLKIDISKISQVYIGIRDKCHCGCTGNYYQTSYMVGGNELDIDDEFVQDKLELAKEWFQDKDLNPLIDQTTYDDTYIDIPFIDPSYEYLNGSKDEDDNSEEEEDIIITMTFYFDDIKIVD